MDDEDHALKKRAEEIDAILDEFVGPVEAMDKQRLMLLAPEIATTPPEFFEAMFRKAVDKAEARRHPKGVFPSHVRSASEDASRPKPAPGRSSGGQIEETQLERAIKHPFNAAAVTATGCLVRFRAVFQRPESSAGERRLLKSRRIKTPEA